MKVITREELKEKLDRGDQFKLYMTLGRRAFEQSHIPGSLRLDHVTEVAGSLSPEEEIVVYCVNPACPASIRVYMGLQKLGYKNVYRCAGGVEAWYGAGYELVGSSAN